MAIYSNKAAPRAALRQGAGRSRLHSLAATLALPALLAGTDGRAEECVYLANRPQHGLEVIRGSTSYVIPTGDRGDLGMSEVILADGTAFASYQSFAGPGQVVEVDLVSRTVGRTFDVGRGGGMAYANGKLYVANFEEGTLTAIDIAGGERREVDGPWGEAPDLLVASADGRLLFAGHNNWFTPSSRVWVLDTESDEVTTSFAVGAFSGIAVYGPTVLVAADGAISAFEPSGRQYTKAWEVRGTGRAWAFEIAGGRVFSTLSGIGAPVIDVALVPPRTVAEHTFIFGPQIEQLIGPLGGGAEYLYATSVHGMWTLSLDTGEISLIRERYAAFGDVDVGPCWGTPEPTRTPTPVPTPSEIEPTGDEECIYVTDDGREGDESLLILHGEWEYRIPLEMRHPRGVIVGGGVAYVNHAEWRDEGGPLPPPRVSVIDLPRKTVVGNHYVGLWTGDIAWARGKLYAGAGGGLIAIDVATGAQGRIFGVSGGRLDVAPDETHLYGGGGGVAVFDLERAEVVSVFGTDQGVAEVAAYDGGFVQAGARMALRRYVRTGGWYVPAWEVQDAGFSWGLAVGGGSVFSATDSPLDPLLYRNGPLLEVPLDAPDARQIHYLEPGAFLPLRSIDIDSAGEFLYAIGGRGLYRFSLSTSETELLRPSGTFQRLVLAPCPGEPGPTWTATPTPTETRTRTPSFSPTPSPTATPTRTPRRSATPTRTPSVPATASPTATPPVATRTPTPSRTPTSTPHAPASLTPEATTPPPSQTPGEPTATGTRRVTPTPTAATPRASHTPPPEATPTPPLPGDADCDGMLTDADADAAIASVFEPAAGTACGADCDRDGDVRAADLLCAVAARAAR